MPAVQHLPGAIDHDAIDRQREAGEDERVEQRFCRVACKHRAVVVEHDQVRVGARDDVPAIVAAGGGAAGERKLEERPTGLRPPDRGDVAHLPDEPLAVFEPAQLLEGIDRDVAVGTDGDAPTRLEEMLQRKQPVAEIRFRAGAKTDYCAAPRDSRLFLVIGMRGMHETPALIDVAVVQQPGDRMHAERRETVVGFFHLLGDVQMHRRIVAGSDRGDFSQRLHGNRTQAVHADAGPDAVAAGCRHFFVVLDELVALPDEAPLFTARRRVVEAGAFIKDRHIGQADAGAGRGIRKRFEHRFGGARLAGLVMQVMKFRDGGEAGRHHLRVRLASDHFERRRVDAAGQRVHPRSPGPEVVLVAGTAVFRMAGKGPLEGMAVRVREARDDDTGLDVAVDGRAVGVHAADQPAVDSDADVLGPALGGQREPGKNRCHDGPLRRLYIQASACYGALQLPRSRTACSRSIS